MLGEGVEAERARGRAAERGGISARPGGQALSTRIVPELHFVLDRGVEHAQRMNELFADV